MHCTVVSVNIRASQLAVVRVSVSSVLASVTFVFSLTVSLKENNVFWGKWVGVCVCGGRGCPRGEGLLNAITKLVLSGNVESQPQSQHRAAAFWSQRGRSLLEREQKKKQQPNM